MLGRCEQTVDYDWNMGSPDALVPNDSFSAATAVTGLPFEADVPLVGGTREANEPVCGGFGGTLWYLWRKA